MAWTCPACDSTVHHTEDAPRPGIIYRCPVCRLELVTDPASGKMTVAPMPGEKRQPTGNKAVAPLPTQAKDASLPLEGKRKTPSRAHDRAKAK